MPAKQQIDDLRTSLERVRQINWADGTHSLPSNINKNLLNQCSDLIQSYIDNHEESTLNKKNVKQQKSKSITAKRIKHTSNRIQSKKNTSKIKSKKSTRPITSRAVALKKPSLSNNYPCYPSSFPCFRSCGPINCPKNKLPMPRDLWYRLVYSQLLEEHNGKRKRSGDSSSNENLSNRYDARRQKTMNAALSSSAMQVVKQNAAPMSNDLSKSIERKSILQWDGSPSLSIESHLEKTMPSRIERVQYIPLTLPLTLTEESCQSKESIQPAVSEQHAGKQGNSAEIARQITNADLHQLCSKEHLDIKTFFTQTSQVELIPRSAIKRNVSMDGAFDKLMSVPSAAPSTVLSNDRSRCDTITIASSERAYEPSTTMISKHDSFVSFEHPLLNHLIEYYHLDQISRFGLCKRLHRRLLHVRQKIEDMSTNEIEIKLKHKRDALMKKRQTSVQVMTRDERVAMAELELSVHEYVQTLDTRSTQRQERVINDESDVDRSTALPSVHLPVLNSSIDSQTSMAPSISTVHTVQPSQLSQSTTTNPSKHLNKVSSWSHALLPELMNMFDSLTSVRRHEIQKQLARRYEHIRRKAKEMTHEELKAQIEAKSRALVQSKQVTQANEDELLRIAELEISLFELEIEQSERTRS